MTPPPGLTDYRRLFAAYALALLGTGVAIVGLSLLAFDLAGDDAGHVIATALSIKVFAYVVVAPLAAALTSGLPKKPLLITLDLIRAGAILTLPFTTTEMHLYIAVFVFTAASAAFTPTYQAIVPHLLPDPDAYARALAKSRAATELENAISPLAAAALLLIFSYKGLFLAAMGAFLVSIAFLLTARLPAPSPVPRRALLGQLTLGPRLLLTTRAFRGLLPLHLAAGLATAMVMVNTVLLVQGRFGLDNRATAVAFAAFGLGSVAGAVSVPRLLARIGERPTILAGCVALTLGLFAGAALDRYGAMIALWLLLGAATAIAVTPAPFLLRREAPRDQHGVLYAALFALANAAMLVAYPAAGWLDVENAPIAAFAILGVAAAAATTATALAWPRAPTEPKAPAPRP